MDNIKLFMTMCPNIEEIKLFNLENSYMYFNIFFEDEMNLRELKQKYVGSILHEHTMCIPIYVNVLNLKKVEMFYEFAQEHLRSGNDAGELLFRHIASLNGNRNIYGIYFDIYDFLFPRNK